MSNRLTHAVLSVGLAATMLAAVPPTASATNPQDTTGGSTALPDTNNDGFLEARSVETAFPAAAATGESVEDLSQRSETATVVVNPDGTQTRAEAVAPIRVKQSGKWVDVDYDLKKQADGSWVPKAAAVDVRIDGGAANEAARVTFDDSRYLAVMWPEKLPEPSVDGGVATYKLSDSKDLLIIVTADGVNAHIRLNKKPAKDDRSFDFGLRTEGVDVVQSKGGLALVDEDGGKHLGGTSALVAWDATVDAGGDPANTVALDADLGDESTKKGVTQQPLELASPNAFLDDPNTKYPVIIDPNFASLNIARDTWVRSGTSEQGSDVKLVIGKINGDSNTNPARTYIQFYDGWLEGKDIVSAQLRIWQYYGYTCSDRQMSIHAVANDWNAGMTWPNLPTTDSGLPGVYVGKNFCGGGQVTADLTGMVRARAGGRPGHGIRLMASNETQSSYERRFCSANFSAAHSVCQTAGAVPYIYVTYDTQVDVYGFGNLGPNANAGGTMGAAEFNAAGISMDEITENNTVSTFDPEVPYEPSTEEDPAAESSVGLSAAAGTGLDPEDENQFDPAIPLDQTGPEVLSYGGSYSPGYTAAAGTYPYNPYAFEIMRIYHRAKQPYAGYFAVRRGSPYKFTAANGKTYNPFGWSKAYVKHNATLKMIKRTLKAGWYLEAPQAWEIIAYKLKCYAEVLCTVSKAQPIRVIYSNNVTPSVTGDNYARGVITAYCPNESKDEWCDDWVKVAARKY